jgi:6,7-dimethyl-8-ribityllumazine synthase
VVKINGSSHPVTVQAKTLTTCATGSLLVSGSTEDYYYVFDGVGTQMASARVGASLAFFPGTYGLRINGSGSTAAVSPGSASEVKTGLVNVRGTTDEYYYVFDPSGTQLASARLGSPLGLFTGTYTVKVNNSDGKAEVRAGEAADVQTGTVVVQGTTDEYYYVFDASGRQLASNRLGRPLALLEGSYSIKVNNTPATAAIKAGQLVELATGTLTVRGTGSDYFYVADGSGTQLGSSRLGTPMALFPGSYPVKLRGTEKVVTVKAGAAAAVDW